MKLKDSQKLILASKSPRRKDLLEQLGIAIKICPSNVDEGKLSIYSADSAKKFALNLSQLKAETTARQYPNDWVLGADTIVVINDKILGKPKSEADAFNMLKQLNNNEHSVYTAFCLCHQNSKIQVSRVLETRVCFKNCTDEELKWYIRSKEPFGKAGAYAIQEKGAFMVKSIIGSYSNVVGLPVCEVIEELKKLNLIQF
ncbi:MAG: Maf family protein [Desulfobacula sp.]|nr:Maf family protein [Desulfobacula sp.]